MKPEEFKEIVLKEARKNRPDLDDELIMAIVNAMMVFLKTEEDVKTAIDIFNKTK